jgi:hypothetical protein
VRVDAQRIAGENDEVGILAGLERADAGLEPENLRVGEGDGGEGAGARHAGADAKRGRAEEKARVGDAVIGVESHEHAGLFEDRAVVEFEVARLEFAAGGIDDDDRAGDLGGGDLRGDLPAFRDMVEHDLEAEFPGEPQDGRDVVVAVRVALDDALPIQHLDQLLKREVARRQLVGVALGALDFLPVFLRFHERLAQQGGGLPARAGKRRGADRIGAVGHFHAAGNRAVGGA